MKQILALFTVVMLNLNVMASENPYLINVNIDTKVMELDLSKIVGKTANVTINNMKGEEIFSEFITVKSKSRLYNLKNLSVGTYTVIVEDENQVTYQKVYVSKNSLLADGQVEEITRPMVTQRNQKWIVSSTNNSYPSNVTIVDNEGNVIYTEKSKLYAPVKSYNVSKLKSGEYRLDYTVKNKTFSQNITLK